MIKSQFDYSELTYSEGWLFVNLYDAYYGTPHFKCKEIETDSIELSELVKEIEANLVKKTEANLVKADSRDLAKEKENQWYHCGRFHREDGPAVEVKQNAVS